ncbi:UNVERIFIED_CONTAM: hypothetical protein HDU68_003952, partial [Siphonaria sp. JEL0065]
NGIELSDHLQLRYLLIVASLIVGLDIAMYLNTSSNELSATIMIPIIPVASLSGYLAKKKPSAMVL